MEVWLLDPAAMTPYYDISLLAALQAQGVEARLLTSRFLHEERVPLSEGRAEYLFFHSLERWSEVLRRRPRLRRAVRLAAYPFGLTRMWQAFWRNPPDVVHIQWTLLPALDRFLYRRMAERAPLVLTLHDPLPHTASLMRVNDMQPLVALATRVIVHAEENQKELLTRVKIAPHRVSVVPHGPLFEEQPMPTRAEARARLNLDPGARIVLFFGLIKPYKGLADLIEAMALLRETHPTAHLLICGRPEGSFAPYREALTTHRLESVSSLYLEYVASAEVPYFFTAADVVCLPYWEASQSGVLLAAYRFGLPVVVTDVGGLPESVDEGQNGYVVPSRNPPALAEALGKLLSDPARCEQFGAHSRALAQARFGWERAAALTRAVYQQAIADYTQGQPARRGSNAA